MSAKPNLKLVNPSEEPKSETSESLPAMPVPTDRLEAAKQALGTRYLCHPDNKVQRIKKRAQRLSILDQWKRTR